MKPTISNAFNDESAGAESGGVTPPRRAWAEEPGTASRARKRHPHKSLASSLAAMQVDLREAAFGWSLDLSPMHAIDVLQALKIESESTQYLVSLEQSAWRDGEHAMPISEIAQRLAIPVIAKIDVDQLVMDEIPVRQLVSLCQPSRLVLVAVEGEIDERDAAAINKAIEAGRSPLTAELRAIAALEVLGDRSVVLHVRDKTLALSVVADNFRHYLAALSNAGPESFTAPEPWQLERLLEQTGMLTVRPIETQMFSTSVDVGVNTTSERFSQPANRSLIYDIPSNSWHDEP